MQQSIDTLVHLTNLPTHNDLQTNEARMPFPLVDGMNSSLSSPAATSTTCYVCNLGGSDLRMLGCCGCTIHSTCAPLSLILDHPRQETSPCSPSEPGGSSPKDDGTSTGTASPRTTGTSFQTSTGSVAKECCLPVVASPRLDQNATCPACQSASVRGIEILPLSLEWLDEAIQLRAASSSHCDEDGEAISGPTTNEKDAATTAGEGRKNKKKRAHVETKSVAERQIRAAYVVYSNGMQQSSSSTTGSLVGCDTGEEIRQRTGRWTAAEKKYVDQLVRAFDEGRLPIPHGTKLSSFLSDAILCKASRLTKKMKKARLSTRAFNLNFETASAVTITSADPSSEKANETTTPSTNAASLLSELQGSFITTLPSQATRMEYMFFLAKNWRSWFSDLCVQVGYPFLEATAFLGSLEEFERLASNADEAMRSVRRRRMGLCLGINNNSNNNNNNNNNSVSPLPPLPSVVVSSSDSTARSSSSLDLMLENDYKGNHPVDETQNVGCSNFYSPDEEGDDKRNDPSIRIYLDDAGHVDDLIDESFVDLMTNKEQDPAEKSSSIPTSQQSKLFSSSSYKQTRYKGTFLEVIASNMEAMDLPFQHADVWVPTFGESTSGNHLPHEDIRLVHAGDVTRRDKGDALLAAFENFGTYSKSFSFAPTKGLVGRVFASGETQWEFGINNLDPDFFLRAGGAEEYGVQSAIAIPMASPSVGRLVLVLYSCHEVPQDENLVRDFCEEISRYQPQPKWELVIGIRNDPSLTAAPSSQLFRHRASAMAPTSNAPSNQAEMIDAAKGTSSSTPPVACITINHEMQQNHSLPSAKANSPRAKQDGGDSSEKEMIALLGEHLAESLINGYGSYSSLPPPLMKFRLFLLRPKDRRTQDDNDMIEILKRSFSCYTSSKTSPLDAAQKAQVASLIAKEWECLCDARVAPAIADQLHDGWTTAATTGTPPASLVNCIYPGRMTMQSESTSDHDGYRSHEMEPVMPPLGKTFHSRPLALPSFSSTTSMRREFQSRNDGCQAAAISDTNSIGSSNSHHS